MNKRAFKSRVMSVETLENRQLMAGDITYDATSKLLFVTGDQFNDQVEVRFQGNDVHVDLKTQRSNGTFDHRDRTKRIGDVQRVIVSGLNGDDSVSVVQGTLNNGVTLANIQVEFGGGGGNDVFTNASAARSNVFGGDGNDLLVGGSNVDRMYGDAGNDTIYGGDGNDAIYGGLGDDRLNGQNGADELYGQWGNDLIWGNAGGDYLYGGDGNDNLYGGADNDNLRGEAGNDYLSGETGNDLEWGGLGDDSLDGGMGNDIMQGEDGNDYMAGGDGNDVMLGGNGNDTMLGDTGEDQLYGNNGDDYLNGGYDHQLDYLVGGAGADTFQSRFVHRLWGGFEIVREEDWVGDFWLTDVIKKRYV
jgi:Ca2+-binding RTX toxin-like protein